MSNAVIGDQVVGAVVWLLLLSCVEVRGLLAFDAFEAKSQLAMLKVKARK